MFHVHGHSPINSWGLIRNSYLFVDFFFVLSGFVIAWKYAACMTATLACSAFTYHWVETPGRDWTRRWLHSGKPAVAARQPGSGSASTL